MTEAGYRRLKKKLNRFHKFSFPMPRKGKGFSPQQKAAITRLATHKKPDGTREPSALMNSINKLSKVKSEGYSFVPKKRGVNMEKLPHTIKTNKGIFYPRPGAHIVMNKIGKKRKQASIEIKFRQLRERYFQFPLDIRGNMELVEMYVDDLIERFKPDYVMWAVFGNSAGRYTPEAFGLYMPDLNRSAIERKRKLSQQESLDGLSGVFLGYEPKH